MKKKIVLFAAITLSMLSSSLSSDCLRVGISIGSADHRSNLKFVETRQKTKFEHQDPFVGAFVGYDHLISETPLFIGIEAGVVNHNSEKKQAMGETPSYSAKMKTNNSITGAMRLGVSAKNVLIYTKTGLSSTNWKTSIKTPIDEHQTNFQNVGYVFGFGLECKMNHNFSFGLEHTFIKHNALRNVHPEFDIKISPNTHTTSLRLVYSL